MTSRSPLEPVLPSFLACLRKTKPKFTLPKCDRPGQSRFLAHHPLKRNETSRNQVAKKCRKRVSFSRMTDVSYSKFQNLSDSDCRDKRCHWSHLFRHTLDDAAAQNKEEKKKKIQKEVRWEDRRRCEPADRQSPATLRYVVTFSRCFVSTRTFWE